MHSFNYLSTAFGFFLLVNITFFGTSVAMPTGINRSSHHRPRHIPHSMVRLHTRQAPPQPSETGGASRHTGQENDSYTPFAVMFPSIAMSQHAENPVATPAPIANPARDAIPEPNATPSIYLGPGPVLPPSSSTPESLNGTDSAFTAESPGHHKHRYSVPVHRLIIVVGVVAGFCFLILLVMIIAELRATRLAKAWMKKDAMLAAQAAGTSNDHRNSPATPTTSGSRSSTSTTEGKLFEKPIGLGITPFIQLPPALATRGRANTNEKQPSNIVRSHRYHGRRSKMGNIMGSGSGSGSEFPRSKFSMTSSDYPYSVQSSYPSTSSEPSTPSASDSSSSMLASMHHQVPVFVVDDCVSPSQPLSPAEFFAMPPSPKGDEREDTALIQQQPTGQQLTRSATVGSTPSFHQRFRTRPPSLSPIKEELHTRNESVIAGSLNVHNGYNYGKPRNV